MNTSHTVSTAKQALHIDKHLKKIFCISYSCPIYIQPSPCPLPHNTTADIWGKGSFGVVRKVQCRQTKAMRVMKIVDKQCLSTQWGDYQEATFSWLGLLGVIFFGFGSEHSLVWWGTVLCFTSEFVWKDLWIYEDPCFKVNVEFSTKVASAFSLFCSF